MDNTLIEASAKIHNELIRNNRIYRIEMALELLKKECIANEGSDLDKAYDLVFQDLMSKLLYLRNEDLWSLKLNV